MIIKDCIDIACGVTSVATLFSLIPVYIAPLCTILTFVWFIIRFYEYIRSKINKDDTDFKF